MAKIMNLDTDQKAEWQTWVESRPPIIQRLCYQYPPDELYEMSPHKLRVYIYSYGEDGTVTVVVSGSYNRVIMPRKVFGIDPKILTPCDLPGEGEEVGELLKTKEEIEAFNEKYRADIVSQDWYLLKEISGKEAMTQEYKWQVNDIVHHRFFRVPQRIVAVDPDRAHVTVVDAETGQGEYRTSVVHLSKFNIVQFCTVTLTDNRLRFHNGKSTFDVAERMATWARIVLPPGYILVGPQPPESFDDDEFAWYVCDEETGDIMIYGGASDAVMETEIRPGSLGAQVALS